MSSTTLEKTENKPHFLTRRQLARRWNCSVMTIRRREQDKTLTPYLLAGRDIRFRLEDVVAVEQAARVAA